MIRLVHDLARRIEFVQQGRNYYRATTTVVPFQCSSNLGSNWERVIQTRPRFVGQDNTTSPRTHAVSRGLRQMCS